jgi:hypothetical protein
MPITRECFMSKTLDNQLFDITEVLSGNSGYPIPSRPCFNEMTIDYQLYNLWRAWGGGIDPDAQAFIDASGATDIQGINDFVKGVKALGLWSSMVCWPLRSTQNAGTGSTAYSLGGLGTYNGTLVNGPTWGADGIAFAPSSANFLQITGMTSSFPFEQVFVCSQGSGSDAAPSNYGSTVGDAVISLNRFETNVGISGVSLNLNSVQSIFNIPNTTMFMKGRMESSTQLYVSANTSGETLMSPTSSTWGESRGVEGIQDRRAVGNTTAFWAIFKAASGSSLYALYKSTLGQGLGLP